MPIMPITHIMHIMTVTMQQYPSYLIFLPFCLPTSEYRLFLIIPLTYHLHHIYNKPNIMNSNQKGPLTPQELFSRLTQTDLKQAECIDQATKLTQQRDILVQLILQYEQELHKAHLQDQQEAQLAAIREKLLLQLEQLRKQRAVIDRSIAEQLQALKLTPLQARDQDSWGFEINEARTRNSKLRIRMKDLHNYVAKLEAQNRRLEEERRIIQAGEMQSRQTGGDWRAKIEVLQREHLSYQTEIRDKMRVKEEASLRNVQAQQMEMQERNYRRRMHSMSARAMTPVHNLMHSRHVRQI